MKAKNNSGLRVFGAVGLLTSLGMSACSDGSSSPGSGGEAGGNGTGSTDSWIVGGWLFQDPAYFGYLAVVDDLSQNAEVDLQSIREFPGDIVYTVHDGVVYVGQEDLPTIERW